MSKHPYPEHIRDKVALGLFAADCEDNPELDPNEEPHPGYYEYADTALQALWDASRVDTVEQLEALPDNAIVHDGYFSYEKDVYAWRGGGVPYYITHDEMDLPMTIIYWGDTDE